MLSGKKLLKGILPSLLCLVAILVAACGQSSPGTTGPTVNLSPASQDKQIFREALGGPDISTFDPALSTDSDSITAIDAVFTGLVQLNDKLEVVPQLAASWKSSSDGLTWTFTLKPNLKFSDGTPLTSKDVAYSIDRALQPAVKSGTAPIYLALIKDSDKLNAGKIKTIIGDSLLTPDDNTIVIIANQAAAYFLEALTYPSSYVVNQALIKKYGNKQFTDHLGEGAGAGPFMVSQYSHSIGITLVPNPNYYGPHPKLAQLQMPFYQDNDTAYKAYQTGQLETVSIPTAHFATDKNSSEYHRVPELTIVYYAMNYNVKPFDNIKIRQAFALALNKDVLTHDILKDVVNPTWHIVPQGMPGYNANLTGPMGVKSTAGDSNLAKQLFQQGLQESGYTLATLPPIKLTLTAKTQDAKNVLQAAINMWKTVLGVSVIADLVEFSKLLDAIVSNKLQFWRIGWIADYPDAQDWLTLQFDKGVPNNNMNYGQNNSSNAAAQQAVQKAMEQADITQDQNARLQAYENAEQQLVNDVAWLPLYQNVGNYLLKSYVSGYVFNAQVLTPPDDWGSIYIVQH